MNCSKSQKKKHNYVHNFGYNRLVWAVWPKYHGINNLISCQNCTYNNILQLKSWKYFIWCLAEEIMYTGLKWVNNDKFSSLNTGFMWNTNLGDGMLVLLLLCGVRGLSATDKVMLGVPSEITSTSLSSYSINLSINTSSWAHRGYGFLQV